jgi:hypothetical protein
VPRPATFTLLRERMSVRIGLEFRTQVNELA